MKLVTVDVRERTVITSDTIAPKTEIPFVSTILAHLIPPDVVIEAFVVFVTVRDEEKLPAPVEILVVEKFDRQVKPEHVILVADKAAKFAVPLIAVIFPAQVIFPELLIFPVLLILPVLILPVLIFPALIFPLVLSDTLFKIFAEIVPVDVMFKIFAVPPIVIAGEEIAPDDTNDTVEIVGLVIDKDEFILVQDTLPAHDILAHSNPKLSFAAVPVIISVNVPLPARIILVVIVAAVSPVVNLAVTVVISVPDAVWNPSNVT